MSRGLWIRVAADLRLRKVVWRCAEALGIKPAKAAGHLVFLWGAAAQSEGNGDLTDVSDSQLEEWAGWDGKRGKFAGWVREQHTTGGRINEWDEYQGKLETRRASDRDRQKKHREKKADVTPPSRGHHAGARRDPMRNENENDNGTEQTTSSSSTEPEEIAERAPEQPVDHATAPAQYHALADRLSAIPNGVRVLDSFLARRPKDQEFAALVCEIDGWFDGLNTPGGKPFTAPAVVTGLSDYVLASGTSYAPVHVRSFVERAQKYLDRPATSSRPSGRKPNPGDEMFANVQAGFAARGKP